MVYLRDRNMWWCACLLQKKKKANTNFFNVLQLVQSSSYVAAAFLDQFRARIGNLSADEWKMLISNFSSSLPQDLLDKAPANVIMDKWVDFSRE